MMIKPIFHNTRTLLGATLIAGAAMIGASCCSNASKKTNVDLTTCHDVYLRSQPIKIQDGVSLELNSKTYLMSNGKLLVYDKAGKSWKDAKGEIDCYGYQRDVFVDIAQAKEEIKDTLVLSKADIEYMQKHPNKLNSSRKNTDYSSPVLAGSENRKVKSTDGNSIVMSASEYSFAVNHSTPNLTISYDATKETVER